MMRVDVWDLGVVPCNMRAGMDSLLARVVGVFRSARPHVAYAFTNARATRLKVLINDGYGLWLCMPVTATEKCYNSPTRPPVRRATETHTPSCERGLQSGLRRQPSMLHHNSPGLRLDQKG